MKFRSLISAGAAAAALAAPGAALAAETDETSVTVSGDAAGLTFVGKPTFGDFPGITLDGTTKSALANGGAFAVKDARGTTDGWRVTIQASQFTETTTPTLKLPTGALTVAALPDITPETALSPLVSALTAPVLNSSLVGQAIDGDSAYNYVVSAANLAALGQWNVAAKTGALQVSVPPTTAAGTYESTITTTLVSGVS